ncbi:hypothetical protein HWC80_gp094 [Mycobacterium phage Indlulamithi]|uniref:Uncharacterized protein n=1 Tax=Mycobacterium phage Indlulamithi TaxID=2656582 RepID=A0A649VCR0_9CAUD|nr:hypothetical protein HWC80_gp094 [Mycobacterium phage Indlulamithi]QGJ90118.1 hypothetical protein PBI_INDLULAMITHI_80 [Mycobacterium phage Indlulamithi]
MPSGATEMKKIMRHSKPVPQTGRTLINRIEAQMDKRRKAMENHYVATGQQDTINRGRYEGLAAALAILRSSSVAVEYERSNERLGID